MATKKRKPKRKKKYCPGQFGPGGRRVKRGTCARTRCKGQMAGSTKGGRPKRRKTTTCLKPKRKKTARKRPATRRRPARKRTKGVMSHGHMVYGAAAKAVKRKRARKGKAPKRRASPKRRRERAVRGHYGRTISGGGYEFTREELRQLERM